MRSRRRAVGMYEITALGDFQGLWEGWGSDTLALQSYDIIALRLYFLLLLIRTDRGVRPLEMSV